MISDLNIGLVADLNDLDDGVVVLALAVVVVSRKRIVDHELDVVVVAAPVDDNDPFAGFGVGAFFFFLFLVQMKSYFLSTVEMLSSMFFNYCK